MTSTANRVGPKRFEDGRLMRPYPKAIAVMIDSWDGDDPWGSAMAQGFAIGEVAAAIGNFEVCEVLQFQRGATEQPTLSTLEEDDDFDTAMLAASVRVEEVTEADLMLAARVISRYIGLCKAAGLDY